MKKRMLGILLSIFLIVGMLPMGLTAYGETRAFTVQPVGGEAPYKGGFEVSWETNFSPVNFALVEYNADDTVYDIYDWGMVTETSCTVYPVMEAGSYFRFRAYYGDGDTDYVESDAFTVTEGLPLLYVSGVQLNDGEYLANGATEPTTAKPEGGYAYFKNEELTLHNYEYQGNGYMYNTEYQNYAAIYANFFLKLYLEGTNKIKTSARYSDGIHIDDNNLVVYREGVLDINAINDGIYTGGYTDIVGSTLTVQAGNAALCTDRGFYMYGGQCTTSGAYGINTLDGTVEISGGVMDIEARCYGIYSETNDIYITGGNVNVTSYETVYDDDYRALYTVPLGCDSMILQASTEHDGALTEYVAENHDSYDRIVFTDTKADLYVGGVGLQDDHYLANGATASTATKPEGGYAYYKDGVLTLNGYEYEGIGYQYHEDEPYGAVIYARTNLTILLEGENTLTTTAEESETIYGYGGSITIDGDGTLNLTATYDGFFADGIITVNGGKLVIHAGDDGISADRNIVINGGDIAITAEYGLYTRTGTGIIAINGGTIDLETEYAAILNEEGTFIFNGGNLDARVNTEEENCWALAAAELMMGDVTMKAATTVGEELVDFVEADNSTYKHVVIKEAVLYGDVDLDGKVTAADALEVLKSVVGKVTLTEAQFTAADTDGNGKADATDALNILKKVVGKIEKFPIEQ